MEHINLSSLAEERAEKAENLKAFSGLKLLHVKRQVASILGLIGNNGIFDEYTKHDISHINYMLKSLEQIIPNDTKSKLTSSSWLMLTLAIYFHDLGMLVTKEEFESRNNSEFTLFKKSIIEGKYGLDYKDKILSLNADKVDRFIYQELVRKTHAERIRYWILDESNPKFNQELKVAKEIKELMSSVDYMFKRDLAMICESHNLSDLDDFEKYKTNQQYGPSEEEVVNLHYCALILRTADLLHITSDRTPSIEYNLINPSDPISQEEWAKQKAVKAIRPQTKKNKEGVLDDSIQKDTFEVIAFFEEEKGFFGLGAYIDYANKQLKENYRFNELAKKLSGLEFSYPWRNIDDSNIETKDFEKIQFEFILDQTKILDLLVGHTLYNDSTVVLRELTQNAIDASKLKKYELVQAKIYDYEPSIKIKWDENRRELSFIDNGTGMTLEIIQNHLLKVGSSRYQDESFKKLFPDFSPISRFGIGLLTCFLIADDIDIITKSEETEKAILLKIKKIHGKYLLKYLSPEKVNELIRKHGTEIKLYVRADIDFSNILNDLRKWILFPDCKLEFETATETFAIGYSSPGELLRTYLKDIGYNVDEKSLKVKEVTKEGVTLAFALKFVEHWKEWDFLEFHNVERQSTFPIGTCIEGIRIDFNSPGFNERNIYAIVNSSGKNAPKTNVARSNIEITPERENLLLLVYQLYLEHIEGELENLRKEGFSISWAAQEANWLLKTFARHGRYRNNYNYNIEDVKSFEQALSKVKLLVIEKKDNRDIMSIAELKRQKHFWTIDSASYTSADSIIKEIKSSDTSALTLLKTIFGKEDSGTKHIDFLLSNNSYSLPIENVIRNTFQVDAIKIIPEQRRLDLRWSINSAKLWEEILIMDDDYSSNMKRCYVQIEELEIDESINQIAINSSDALFILKNSELNKYLVALINKFSNKSDEETLILSKVVNIINYLFHYKDLDRTKIEDIIMSIFDRSKNRDVNKIFWDKIDKDELMEIVLKTSFISYDNTIWYRRLSQYIY